MTQSERVERFIRTHPGCTTMELQRGCDPWISNPRARISDLRARGVDVVCEKRPDGRDGFRIREPRPVDAGEQIGLSL